MLSRPFDRFGDVRHRIIQSSGVENDGVMKNNKGVDVPGDPTLHALCGASGTGGLFFFGVEQGFDYIAASFVRTAADVRGNAVVFWTRRLLYPDHR